MNSSSFYVYANPSGTEAVPDLSGWAMKVDRGGDVNISDDLTVADLEQLEDQQLQVT